MVVPVGGIVFLALLVFLKVPNPHTPVLSGLKAIDWIGCILIMGGALMILLGLDLGDVSYPWSSATVICLIVFGAAVVGLFIYNEWKLSSNPIIPLRIFRNISTSAAFGVFAMNFFVFNGIAYYLPLYSQSVLGANALTSGIYMLPLIVTTCLASALAAFLIQKTGKYRALMYIAQVLFTLGVGLFINLDFDSGIIKLILYEIITGIGTGLNDEAPTIAALASTSERDAAVTISAMTFLRSLTSAVSIVVGGVIFQNQMTAAGPRLATQIGENNASLFSGTKASSNFELISTLPVDQQVVVREAYFDAMKKVWIMVCKSSYSWHLGADI
jgi:Na+/melibiose symporter-like transporter